MDDDALTRQVRTLERELADLKRQVAHEHEMRGFAQDRLDRLERGLYGKISRAEAIGLLWIALPIIFAVVTILAVVLVMAKPHP